MREENNGPAHIKVKQVRSDNNHYSSTYLGLRNLNVSVASRCGEPTQLKRR